MLDGVAGAWHISEFAFSFDNTKRCEQGTGDTPTAQALAKKMAAAWASFALNGNHANHGLAWTPANSTRQQTIVFDKMCRMVDNPDRDLRRVLSS